MVYQDILMGLQKAKKRRSKSLDDIDLSEISEKVLDRKAWARSAQRWNLPVFCPKDSLELLGTNLVDFNFHSHR